MLEAAGYQVWCRRRRCAAAGRSTTSACWTRPRDLLREILNTLRPQIQAGVPVVGLEPSCVAVFRDELTNLFPDDEDAKRLHDQSFLLSEFLNQKVEGYQPPRLERKALVHGHCHHKSIMGMDDETALLKKMGLDFDMPEPGCCGMAGSFGFESGQHYDVSIACGERALLPAVRQAADDTLIIANGFSCQQQIGQTTQRRPLHLAQVLQMALQRQGGRYDREPALAANGANGHALTAHRNKELLLAGAGAALAGWLIWDLTRR